MSARVLAATSRHAGRLAALAGVVWCGSLALSLAIGASSVTTAELLGAGLQRLRGLPPQSDAEALAQTVLFSLRLPRALTAGLCGGALSAAGVLSQGLFRNSLASPSVLGSEAGGALAAARLFYAGAAYLHWLTLPVFAFLGALVVTAVICRLAAARPGQLETLLLAGFAVNAIVAACTSLIVSLSLEDYKKASAVMHWLLGGFAAKGWEHAAMAAVPAALGLALAWPLAPRLDVLALGEEQAQSLSVDLRSLRRYATAAMALLVGGAVAVGGAIPFVGLIVPHLTRRLVGPAHRRLLVLSTLNGASLTILADIAARTLRAPIELEVGILTSLLGGPFFLYLLLKPERPQ